MSELKEYTLDRFVDGRKMAQGAKVKAASLDEACKKAYHLDYLGYHNDQA